MSCQIDLDVFNGPMDLLLYLIAKEEVDIQEISISLVVDQYLEYLRLLQEDNVNVTSDFLVMASTLIFIKSKALLPTEEIDLEEEIDQQDDLIQHLLEYKKIKILSRALLDRAHRTSLLVPRPHVSDKIAEESVSFEELNLWDIIQAFSRIVKETQLDKSFDVIHSDKPLAHYIGSILETLRSRDRIDFEALLLEEKSRKEAVCVFIGILELVKRKIATVEIPEDEGKLEIRLNVTHEELDSLKVDGQYQLRLLGLEEEEAIEDEESEEAEAPQPEEPPAESEAAAMEGAF